MDKLINAAVRLMYQNNIISEYDLDIIRYGTEILILKIIFFILTVLVGAIGKCLPEIIIFMIAFEPLRIFAGGYHADTRIKCFFLSFFMLILVTSAVKYVPLSFVPYILLINIVSVTTVCLTAPVGTKKKALDPLEKAVYGKRARIILAVEYTLSVICFISGSNHLSLIISISIFLSALLNASGYIADRKKV